MIEHTVTFNLKHSPGSQEEQQFFDAANELAEIPGVIDFAIRRQVSEKHSHAFGITMFFASDDEYQAYNSHPLHTAFVENRWKKEVTDFQEADFVRLDLS
jgi:heme-degrading monooxygenase HmoA